MTPDEIEFVTEHELPRLEERRKLFESLNMGRTLNLAKKRLKAGDFTLPSPEQMNPPRHRQAHGRRSNWHNGASNGRPRRDGDES